MNKCYCIYQFDRCIEDFVLRGFSQSRDRAEAELADIEVLIGDAKPILAEQSYDQMISHVLRIRLGFLHDVLIRLENKT